MQEDSLKALNERHRRFVEERNWQKHQSPKNLVTALTAEDGHLNALKTILKRYPGNTAVNLGIITKDSVVNMRLGNGWQVFPSREFWKDVEAWQNGDALRYQAEQE